MTVECCLEGVADEGVVEEGLVPLEGGLVVEGSCICVKGGWSNFGDKGVQPQGHGTGEGKARERGMVVAPLSESVPQGGTLGCV